MNEKGHLKSNSTLRSIPSVDSVLNCPQIVRLSEQSPRWLMLAIVRAALDDIRMRYIESDKSGLEAISREAVLEEVVDMVSNGLAKIRTPSLKRLINGTGVIIHTNLGRAPLASEAISLITEVAEGYSNLEYALSKGVRDKRTDHVRELLVRLTGADDSFVVNNNAGAVMLVLNSLAEGREVVVSRGELVEIGGAFRIPDVMSKSGAIMHEVGTTNRTHLTDYERAITGDTALLLKVHTSNYRVVGFSSEVSLEELAGLGKRYNLPVIMDLGSGNLTDLSLFGLKGEPLINEILSKGVDVVTFSGDKLLGGPQAGVILTKGGSDYMAKIKTNPLARALRIDKLTLAALLATLLLYLKGNPTDSIPVLKMISKRMEDIHLMAINCLSDIERVNRGLMRVEMKDGFTSIGGGALPTESIPTFLIAFSSGKISVESLEEAFRSSSPPVIGRIKDDKFLLDLRTVMEDELSLLVRVYEDIVGRYL